MKKLYQALFVACLYTFGTDIFSGDYVVTLDPRDPAPMYATAMPDDCYMKAKEAFRKGQYNSGSGIQLTAMPFHVHAKQGTNLNGIKNSELGDLGGRANLFAIFNSNLPAGYNSSSPIPALIGTQTSLNTIPDATAVPPVSNNGSIPNQLLLDLQAATYSSGVTTGNENGLIYGGTAFTGSTPGTLPTSAPTPTQFKTIAGLRSLQSQFQELIGYLSIPAKYSKYGSRFEITGATSCGLGASVRLGVSSISQSGEFVSPILFGNVDTTTTNSSGTATTTTVNGAYYLVNGVRVLVNNPFYNDPIVGKVLDPQWYEALKVMKQDTVNQLDEMAQVTGWNLSDFQKTGLEDLRGEIFWRKGIKLATEEPVTFIPYVAVVGSVDITGPTDPNQIFAAPFGNNGHKSYGGNAGFTLDFDNSFEIGSTVGVVTFSRRTENNLRMPNNPEQSVLYPYNASATINPGNTWFASLLLNCHNFEENLTFFMQYMYVGHSKDKVTLTNPSTVFLPKVLENKSMWSSQVANVGLTYEVSPSITIGCGGQIPLKQMNAYRTATFILSIAASH